MIVKVSAGPFVLLVDPAGPQALQPVLERCGFGMTWSPSPEAALFELGQHDVAAVIAVLPLPGLGVGGLCQEVRLRGRVPVVVVTTDDEVDWLDALAAGADDHVRTPLDDRELRARLVSLMRRARGSLSPRRVVRVGELVVRLGRGVVVVEPPLDLTPVQRSLLGFFAGQPGMVLGEDLLADGVRVAHGPISDAQLDAELDGLRAAVDVAAGVADTIERVEDLGWRLRTGAE
jgi:DNA-binding response OmpR family regulator